MGEVVRGGGDKVNRAPEKKKKKTRQRKVILKFSSFCVDLIYDSAPVTHWDRLCCTSVPCPDRCSSRRVWAGDGVR